MLGNALWSQPAARPRIATAAATSTTAAINATTTDRFMPILLFETCETQPTNSGLNGP